MASLSLNSPCATCHLETGVSSSRSNSRRVTFTQTADVCSPVGLSSNFSGQGRQHIGQENGMAIGALHLGRGNASFSGNGSRRVGPVKVAAAKRGFGAGVAAPAVPDVKDEEAEGPWGLEVEQIPDGKSRVRLRVTVPAEVCQNFWAKAIDSLNTEREKELRDGGKKQKPLSASALTRVLGEREVKRAALELLLQATAEEAFQPVASRMITSKYSQQFVKSGDDMVADLDWMQPYTYEVYVDLNPEVRWASERAYAGLQVEVKMDAANPDEEAEKELQSLLKDRGFLRIAQDRGAQMGDVAIMDMATTRVNEDGTAGDPILSCCQKGFQVDTESTSFIPGLVEGLLGMGREEARTLDLRFPQDWPIGALRGVLGRFTVTCKELFVREVPVLEDAIASELVPGATTVAEARELLKAKHRKLFEEGKSQATTLGVLTKLNEVCEVEVPESLIQEDGHHLFALHLAQIQAKYNPSPEQLQQMSSDDQLQLFLRVQRPVCEQRVKQTLAMEDIYERELDTHVTEEELQQELVEAWKEFENVKDRISEDKLKEQAFDLLKEKKTLAWLASNAEVSFVAQS